MKKNSFCAWISVCFGGIRQFLGRLFSWKGKDPFWRAVWAVISLSLLAFVGCWLFDYYWFYHRIEERCVERRFLSANLSFERRWSNQEKGDIVRPLTGEKLLEDVDWVAVSPDEDSLVVFSSRGRRGYLNRFTGRVAVAPKYDAAWVFSEGRAAVAEDGQVYFIDPSGRPVNGRRFKYNPSHNSYVYHGDYCAMPGESGLLGLIDKRGDWAVEPKYQRAVAVVHDYWLMREGDYVRGLWYAFTDKARQVNETGCREMSVVEDLGVVCTKPNHTKEIINFEGRRVEKFLVYDMEPLYYDTGRKDRQGKPVEEECTLWRYSMDDGYEGLCNAQGEPVTEPLYAVIRPIGRDLYQCSYKGSQVGVLVDSEGTVVSSPASWQARGDSACGRRAM